MHWFTFNLADASIIGAILLFGLLISGLGLRRGTKRQ
jgi:lipoprotein signal peptidase